ncbi:uncharacterized protein LOC108107762 isoform X2 [Drosophila eugracilis]|uniref:uncharacterized protein LOC108107762 isoform X2 n=1 Tax=Drosophila eugracilis TaxID=29029 RepID=UPI0007E774E8|nr:uncharacterized protein LOC108107762 isoform X2 [Drosophila eugracilis]
MASLSILHLNDDCLRHILKYLGLKDLLNLAESFTRIQQLLLDWSPAPYPVFHGNDPEGSKSVLYYSKAAIKLFTIVDNNVKTLGIIQGHSPDEEHLGNMVKDYRIITKTKNKIDFRHCLGEKPKLEDMFRFSSHNYNSSGSVEPVSNSDLITN